jgi:hypothetical protein
LRQLTWRKHTCGQRLWREVCIHDYLPLKFAPTTTRGGDCSHRKCMRGDNYLSYYARTHAYNAFTPVLSLFLLVAAYFLLIKSTFRQRQGRLVFPASPHGGMFFPPQLLAEAPRGTFPPSRQAILGDRIHRGSFLTIVLNRGSYL